MSSSSVEPARFLLNSFTVAATPERFSVSSTEDGDRAEGTAPIDGQDVGAHVHDRMRSRAFANFTGASAEKEEEPHPSGVAPQPAPAPPRSSQLASSRQTASVEWLFAPTANTSPHSRRYTSSHSWQPMWRAPVGSRTDGMCRSGGDDSGIPETPFRWRSSLLHSARTSLLTPVSHGESHGAATGSTLHPETSIRHVSEQLGRSPVGAFTPNIRYRTSSGASPGTRTAPCQLSTAIVKESVSSNGGSRHCSVSPARRASVEWTPPASIHPAHTIAPLLRQSVPTRPSLLQSHRKTQGEAILRRRPPLLATTHQGAAAVSTSFSAGGIPTRSARVVTLCVPAEIAVQPNGDSARRTRRRASLSVSSTSSVTVTGTAPVSNLWMQPERRDLALRRGHEEVAEESEVVAGVTRSSPHAPVHHAEAEEDDEVGGGTETIAIGHLTLRSFTEEYSRFSTEGTVGWVGLQTHLRCHTQSSQIFTLDLTCCHMRRDQWTWFTQDILPQLRVLEVLHLVQMHLEDEAVVELVRGSCGLSAAADGRRTASRSWQQSPSSESRHGRGGSGSGGCAIPSAPLAHLRVLDLSGNAVTQRSCTHLGKMMLWMAGTLEEVRLLGNPLKDYGMQTLSVYVSKLNLETLEQDSSLFPAALRELCAQVRQTCRRGHAERSGLSGLASSSAQSAAVAGVVHAGCSEGEGRGDASDLVARLPLGPVLLDLRDCRASVRGLSEMLAAASRAHRLRTLVLSHNVAGVTSLLPLPAREYHGAANLAKEEEEVECEEREARPRCSDGRGPQPQPLPLPHRLRLVKTPLVYSGALMRRKLTAFNDMAVFATSCALSTLVLYGVPLSQTCSPLGFRELLLNIFFSCPLLDLVDLSDTFEWSLLPPEARLALLAEGNRRDAAEQRLHGLEGRQGLHVYGENEGEVEFRLDSAVVSGQTRLGDIFGELMAHAALNVVVRHRLLPAAFLHVRELHLSSTGLTDAGARGLCMSVRRGRTHTGMLASLVVLNLSDNLMTVRGCVRVISTFLLDDDTKGDLDATRSSPASPGTATATREPMRIAPLTALALQRNAGIESSRSDGMAAGLNGGSNDGADNAEYLQQVCTAAEEAVLRRATLRSAACLNQACRSSSAATRNAATQEEQVPSLTVYFSAPPLWAATRPMSSSVVGDPRPPSTFLSSAAGMDVFYAGCDDQGDVYCTCPCSRFYVPKPASAEATHREDTNAAGLPYSSQQQQQWTSAEASRILAGAATARGGQAVSTLAVPEAIRSDSGALSAGATPTTGVKQQNHTSAGPRRSLFASLDAPRDAVASAMTAAAVGARAGGESPNGLVNTTSLHHLWNCTNDMAATTAISSASVSSSSFSFAPTPLSASMSAAAATRHTSDLGAADADRRFMLLQQQQQAGQPSRRESNFSVSGGASFGELFMSKSEETLPLTLGAPNSIEFSDAAAAAPMGVDVDMSGTLASTAVNVKHTGGRRARLWRTRTFVLSYDHPAGHLLCRALGVLLRPAPDAVGEGARAALDKDLLDALKRALAAFTARSTSEQDNDEGGGGGRGGAGKAASTTVVEVVHYLPPESSSATVADGGDPNQREAEAHWMRFKVTTNERKGVMAQLLQEVLNVPLSEQCTCFERLLQFVGQHVKCGEELDGESSAEDLWDPVRAIERAARSSAAVRARLEIAYGGDAATAVHTRHQYYDAADATLAPISDGGGGTAAAPGAELNGTDNTEGVVRLDHLYSALWKELGLPVSGTARDALPHAPASLCIKEEEAEAPVGGDRRPQLLDRRASGDDLYMFPPTSCDATSRRSSEAAIPLSVPPSAAVHQQQLHVVNLYDRESGELKLREWESLPAPLREGQCDDAFASAAATGDDQGGMERVEDDRETSVDSASVTTPEKQLSYARDMELGGTAAELLPPLFALGDSNAESPQQGSPPVGVALTDQLMRLSPPLEACNTAGAAVAPPFSQQQQQQQHVPRASLAAAEDEKGQQRMDDDSGESDMPRVVTSRLRIGQQSGEERSGSSGEAGSSVRDCSAMLSRPQQELCEGRQHTQPGLAHPGVTGVQAEEAEGEEGIVIAPPIRVQRRPSQLVGRIKTFTLSYTHQEGTAVCRAWRLLHSAMHVHRSKSANSTSASCDDSVDVVAPISPPASLSLSVLAKEAQRCLCDDFLAFLQPPDEDIEHAVLSVSLNCDSSVATAMLQVQVQTNERRAALADRLQHSNHGVRRSVGRGNRSGLVPLSVEEVDRFYFPRLTHLLHQYKTVADMVVQVQTFLQPRAAVQDRLLQSYGSIAALVHYYHGSSAALEHELGISSWQVLMDPTPLGTARAQQLADDVLSPTVAVDRVQRRRNVVAEEGHQGGGAPCEGAPRIPNPQPQPATAGVPQLSRLASANDGASGATNLQGRPPPHPRRLPTPPHAITHTSSISFDEVTEDSTSEEGPVVVLRCTTPTKASHSPSTPQSFHVQYTSGMHQQVFSTTSSSRPVVDGVSERGALNETGDYLDVGTDTGLVSPLTAISSTAGSPNQQHLGLSLEHPAAAAGAVAPSENSLSTQPLPHLLLQPAGDKGEAAAPPGAKSGCDSRQYHYGEASGNATTAAVPVSSSSPLVMSAPKAKTIGGSSTGGSLAPPFQQLAEYNHSNAGGNNNATLQPPQANPRQLGAAAGASDSSSITGLEQCKSEYERVLQGKYKRLMRVAYDGVVRGSVPLDPQHQQKTVIGRGKWGVQKVELSLEWEILFVLTFEKSRKLGRSSRRAQMLVHPVGCGFECAAGDDLSHTASSGIFCGSDAPSPQSSAISCELGDCGHHPSMAPMSKMSRKKEPSRSAASHLIITIQRPFTPDEVGSSSHDMEETVMAGALLTVSSSKPGRLLGVGSDDTSNTSRASAGANQAVQEYVFQLCQPSLTLVIEMKSSKHVQEALRLLKNSIRRATQAVNRSMLNAQIPPPVLTSSSLSVAHHGPPS